MIKRSPLVTHVSRRASGRALMRNGVTKVIEIETMIPVSDSTDEVATIYVVNSRDEVTTGWIELPKPDLIAWAKEIAIASEQDWKVFVYEGVDSGRTWTIAARSSAEAWELLERRLVEDGYSEDERMKVEYLTSNAVKGVFDRPEIVLEYTY